MLIKAIASYNEKAFVFILPSDTVNGNIGRNGNASRLLQSLLAWMLNQLDVRRLSDRA